MIKCASQYFLEIKLNSNQMLVLEERGKPEYRRKTSRSRVENQQTQPTYDAEPGNRTGATLVGSECSDTAPTLLPEYPQCKCTLTLLRLGKMCQSEQKFGSKKTVWL